jgi:xylan 1,4-beta-xylosidase
MAVSRRDALLATASAALAGGLSEARAAPPAPPATPAPAPDWRRGFDNQRVADLGDGRFLNPLIAGDHPDPTILKDGADYYMTFSTFDSYPGLIIWHSRDLVNWRPVGPALHRNIGSVWAPELCKHKGRYYLYIPVKASPNTSYVIWADRIEGPWSDPIDLNLPNHIDPGHAVGEDGSRWLFLSGGDRVRLTDDGLATVGQPEHVYDPWHYPDDWDVEGFSPEGPKILRHKDWFYLVTAVGGTAGPPTGHMVIAARSRSIHGPWENCPANPIVRTVDRAEKWWSRGHATLVEGPDGSWWSVYHGYENGYWTLGRQTLLDPVQWTADGWFRMTGGDLSQPIAKPRGGQAGPHGQPLSDDFRALHVGSRWNFFKPAPQEAQRARVENGSRWS